MNKLLFLFLLLMLPFVANAQSNEPACNIGKSLSVMKQLFPELRYVKSDAKGDEYEDGYPEDGTAIFFYFKDGKVIEATRFIETFFFACAVTEHSIKAIKIKRIFFIYYCIF